MRLRINLATVPLESNRRFALVSATVGGLGLLAMFALSGHAFSVWRSDVEARGAQAQVQKDMEQLSRRRADLEAFFNRPESVERREQAAFLNGLIAQRSFPWTKIFTDLERNLPEGVRVVSIEPTLAGNHVQLKFTVGALNDESKLKFLRALEGSAEFSQIQVLDETRSSRQNETDQVLLSLVAQYSVT